MKIEISCRPVHSIARVSLDAGESVVAESGAMVATSTNVGIQTSGGGLKKGLKRLFGGEAFFRNTFTANGGPGDVWLAQKLCGDMTTLDVAAGREWFIQSSAFVASSPGVEVDTKVGGFRGFFSGAGMFVLKAHGAGPCVVGGFGALHEVEVDGTYVVDTGHLVAWEAGLQYTVGKSGGGWVSSFLSGEGLVCHFSGRGRLWTQTRNAGAYGRTVGLLLPPRG